MASVFTLFMAGCSDDDVANNVATGLKFAEERISIPAEAGTVNITVEWDHAQWTLEQENGVHIIKKMSTMQGGNTLESGTTEVTITFNANTDENPRNQNIYLNNLETGESTIMTLIQAGSVQKGNVYYVDSSAEKEGVGSLEKPYKTIRTAAMILQAGDTLLIKGGTYAEENIKFASSGTSKAMIVLRPASQDDKVIIKHPGTSFVQKPAHIFDLNNISYVWFEGFYFQDYPCGGSAINIKGGVGNVIFNNRFQNIGNSKINEQGQSMININTSNRNVVANNYFYDVFGDGMGIGNVSDHNLICYNTFDTFKGKARGWAGENSSFATNITMGAELEYVNNLVAFNSSTNSRALLWLDRNGSDLIVLRNTSHNSTQFMFNESRCKRNWFYENIGYNIDGVGFETARYSGTGDAPDPRWIGNITYNCKRGFFIHQSWRNEARNNIVVGKKGYTEANILFTELAYNQGPHLFKNNLWFTDGVEKSMKFKEVLISVDEFCKELGDDAYVSADPMFTDPENGDFTLKAGSPAMGAGTMGRDLGAYSVYGPSKVGWNENQPLLTKTFAGFYVPVSEAKVGTHTIAVELNRAAQQEMTVTVQCVAGDAMEGADVDVQKTITFAPGERKKIFNVTVKPTAMPYDQLLAIKIVNVSNGEIGPRNLHAVRIDR